MRRGFRHELFVDLVGAECCGSNRSLGLLAHAGPNIGVEKVCVFYEAVDLRPLFEVEPTGVLFHFFDVGRLDVIFFGADQSKPNSTHRADVQKGASDVIAIADEGDLFSFDVWNGLPQRHEICQRLAWVGLIGQSVDDWNHIVASQFFDRGLRDRAADHKVAVFRENPYEVGDGFSFSPAHIAGEVEGCPPQLRHASFEANSRSQARFLENHGQGTVLEILDTIAGAKLLLELAGQGDDFLKFVESEIEERSDMLHDQLRWCYARSGGLAALNDFGSYASGCIDF